MPSKKNILNNHINQSNLFIKKFNKSKLCLFSNAVEILSKKFHKKILIEISTSIFIKFFEYLTLKNNVKASKIEMHNVTFSPISKNLIKIFLN